MKPRFVIFDLPFGGRDEFEPLEGMPEFRTDFVRPQAYRGGAQVIILPGSGKTVADLSYLRANGGAEIIRHHLARGGVVIGICGGYQMLGEKLIDPAARQGDHTQVDGLGYLPISTVFGPDMLRCRTSAELLIGAGSGSTVQGEEHRSGYSNLTPRSSRYAALHKVASREFFAPLPETTTVVPGIEWRPGREEFDGLVSADRRVWGTYLHLIFYNEAFLHTFFGSVNR
jgi:adenosylcobyric acid synthase